MITGFWHVLFTLVLVSVTCEPVPSNVCHLLQCTTPVTDGTNRSATVVVTYNRTQWKENNGQDIDFDFRAWNWAQLSELVHENGLTDFQVAFNGLNVSRVDVLDGHDEVVCLNLDDNGIKRIGKHAFARFKRLANLSLHGNTITSIDHAFLFHDNVLEYLDLSCNSIETLNGFEDPNWSYLTHLNLSHNHIEQVSEQLAKLDRLEWLNLSDNRIKRGVYPIYLPKNLGHCLLNNNRLDEWPFDAVPDTLTDLGMRFNQIVFTKPARGVRRLDLSHNKLYKFCSECFPSLEEVDLSANYFDSIPEWNASIGAWPLKKLRFNKMPYLQSIKSDAFHKTANLMEIEISTCPALTSIEANTFIHLNAVQKLDLSYNSLQKVPENLVQWGKVNRGVNLQGNPLTCDCSMQWFLDKVIPAMLPQREQHKLLQELRCARPSMYKDQRLVQLTLYDNLLCQKKVERSMVGMEQILQEDEDHFVEKIVLCSLIVAILFTAAYLIHLKCHRPYTVMPIYR